MLITIGLVMTPRFARLSYGSTLALREREFIEADLALGASTLYVLRQGHPAQHHGRAAGHVQPVGGHRHPCGG